MRKIGDLVITLENTKGKDSKIRTKKIDKARKNVGFWKEPEEIKEPAQFQISENSKINIRGNIHSRSESTRGSSAIPRCVPTKGRIPIGTVVLIDKHVQKIESVSLPKILAKCGFNRTTAFTNQRRSKRNWWSRILFIPKYNRCILCTNFFEELENTFGRYWKSTIYSDGMDSI